jgi:hypothetical protein
MKGPHLLDQPILKLVLPLPGQERADGVAALEE